MTKEETDRAKEKLKLTGKQMRLVDATALIVEIKHYIGPDCMGKVDNKFNELVKLIDEELDITHKKREGLK